MLSSLTSILAQAAVLPALLQENSRVSGWVWVIIFIILTIVIWLLLTQATDEDPGIHAHAAEHTDHQAKTVAETEPAAPAPAPVIVEELPAPVAKAPEPVTVVEPPAPAEPPQPDDLVKLEGIGPKVNKVLNAAGIFTFAQLAATDITKLKEILSAADYGYMDPATWPEQAQLAAEGKWEEFEKLTASLKGGRKMA